MKNLMALIAMLLLSPVAKAGGGGGGGVLLNALQGSSAMVFDIGETTELHYIALAQMRDNGWSVEKVVVEKAVIEHVRGLKGALSQSRVDGDWAPLNQVQSE